jgi:hypothetical protein
MHLLLPPLSGRHKLLIILPLSGLRIKINYTKSASESCTFNEVQIKTRLMILRSEQSLESDDQVL